VPKVDAGTEGDHSFPPFFVESTLLGGECLAYIDTEGLMLTINADDWGRSAEITDRILRCYTQGKYPVRVR